MPTDILTQDLLSVFETNDVGDALRMLTDLRSTEKYGAPVSNEDQTELKNIEKQLEAVAMVSLTEGELTEAIESSLDQWLFLPDSVDMINNFRARLLKETFIEDRNALRAKVKAAIERSIASLGV